MAKTAAELRAKADEILAAAKAKAKELRAKADELEAAEDLALLRKLKASGKLDQLKGELNAGNSQGGSREGEEV